MLSVCWAKKTWWWWALTRPLFQPIFKFSIRHYFTSICKVISNAYMHHLKKEWWPVDSIIVWSYHRFGVTWLPNLLGPTLLIIKWPWQKFGVGNLLVPILAPLVGQQLSGTEGPVCYLRYVCWWKLAKPAHTLIMRNAWSPVSPLTGCEVTRAHLTSSQETLQLVQVSCLLNRLFRRKSKKTSKLRVTGLCAGNSPGTGEFPAQMASDAENVSIWWRHHVPDNKDHPIDIDDTSIHESFNCILMIYPETPFTNMV